MKAIHFHDASQPHSAPARIHVIDVIRAAAQLGGLTLAEITGQSRMQPVARWRQRAMFVARLHTDASYPRIAQFFCRDHTTVLFACRKLAAVCAFDFSERRVCDEIVAVAAGYAMRAAWRCAASTYQPEAQS